MRALISVSNKSGLIDFARGLVDRGFEIVSTGGTARALVRGRPAGHPGGPGHRRAGDDGRPREDPPPLRARRHPGPARPSGRPRGAGAARHHADRPGGGESLPVPRDGRQTLHHLRRAHRRHRHRRAVDDPGCGQELQGRPRRDVPRGLRARACGARRARRPVDGRPVRTREGRLRAHRQLRHGHRERARGRGRSRRRMRPRGRARPAAGETRGRDQEAPHAPVRREPAPAGRMVRAGRGCRRPTCRRCSRGRSCRSPTC